MGTKLLSLPILAILSLIFCASAFSTNFATIKNVDGTLCSSGCTWHLLSGNVQKDTPTGTNKGYSYGCGFQYPSDVAVCPLNFTANVWTGFFDGSLDVPIQGWATKPCPVGGGYLYSDTKYWQTYANAAAYWTTQQLNSGCHPQDPSG